MTISTPPENKPAVVWWIDHLQSGGTQKMLAQIISGVSSNVSFQAVVVLNNVIDPILLEHLKKLEVEVRIIGKRKIFFIIGLVQTWIWLKTKNFDTSITFLFYSDIIGSIISYLAKIKRIVSSQRSSNKHYSFPQVWLLSHVLRLTDLIVLNSESYIKDISNYVPNTCRSLVIPNGIDFYAYQNRSTKQSIRNELGLSSNMLLVGAIGRLSPEKGLEILINAVSQITLNNLHLILVGDGPEKDRLVAYSEHLGINNSVSFLGQRTDIVDVLTDLDLFVQASYFEGMPVAVLEAMAVGCPIIASSVDGIKQLITDGIHGRLVPQGNVEYLSKTIDEVLNCREEANFMASQAQLRVKSKFSVESMINLWRHVLTEKRSDYS